MKFVAVSLGIPDDVVFDELALENSPRNWRQGPLPDSTKRIGSKWAMGGSSVLLKLPSVVLPSGSNFLLNPAHVDFGKLQISKPTPFGFDNRMWK